MDNQGNLIKFIFSIKLIPLIVLWVTFNAQAGETTDETGFVYGLTTDYVYDDNILRDQSLTLDAFIFRVRPFVGVGWNTENGTFNLEFTNETAKYEGSSEDNYSDNELSFNANLEFTSRHALDFRSLLLDGHDARGTVFGIGNGRNQQDLDTFTSNTNEISYTYGRDDAVGQLIFSYQWASVDYASRVNPNGEDLTARRDRDDTGFDVRFTYELSAKTDMLISYDRVERKYDIETGLGNTTDSTLIGLQWEATAKTTGRVLIGEQNTDSTLGGLSFDDTVWEVELAWSPKSYSTVTLSTSKSASPSLGLGTSNNVSTTNLDWAHEWNSSLSTNLLIGKQDEDFLGTGISLSTDLLSLSLVYELNDNMRLSVSHDMNDRASNSNLSQFVFDRHVTSLSFNVAY